MAVCPYITLLADSSVSLLPAEVKRLLLHCSMSLFLGLNLIVSA